MHQECYPTELVGILLSGIDDWRFRIAEGDRRRKPLREPAETEVLRILEQVKQLTEILFNGWDWHSHGPVVSLLPTGSNELHNAFPLHIIQWQIFPEGKYLLWNGQWPRSGTGNGEEEQEDGDAPPGEHGPPYSYLGA